METKTQNQMWKKYRSTAIIEARPYVVGENLVEAGLCSSDAEEKEKQNLLKEGDYLVKMFFSGKKGYIMLAFSKETMDRDYCPIQEDTDVGKCGSNHQVIDIEAGLNEELPTRTCNVGDGECLSCQ